MAHKKQDSYGPGAIQVLEGLDAVRKRPGMYIGSTDTKGLHHLIWEVVDNAVDEAMAGHADTITVRLLADGGVEVVDNGRGIPVERHATRRPTVDVVMTVLHAGAKFERGAYTVSGGLHGVGVSVVNALSTRLEVEICRDGHRWHQTYDRSVPQGLRKGAKTTRRGTTVRFWADPAIFDTTAYDRDTVAGRLDQIAYLNAGLQIELVDERVPEGAQTFRYPGGLADFVTELNRGHAVTNRGVISFSGGGSGQHVEVAMQWRTDGAEEVQTFANTINTESGGTHEEGFRAALTTVVNKYARDKKLLKAKDPTPTGDDVRAGLVAVVSVKMSEPQFEGQTKNRLVNTAIKSFVQKICHERLTEWFEANPADAKRIAANAVLRARRRKPPVKTDPMGSLPGKLADCRSTDPRESELYLVEGDSAGGSAKSGRDSEFQAILPLRGKIINVEKARIDRALQNTEVQAIIAGLGTGIHDEFDLATLRYHKIVLMADADIDGQHITTLLLTLLFRFMRPLIENGHVFLAQPPLYKLKWQRSQPEFAYSDRERDGLLKTGIDAGKKINPEGGIQRYKGLGEMDATELWETTMDPSVRLLRRVTLNDAAAADVLFSIIMGDDVDARREFIYENARDVRFLDA